MNLLITAGPTREPIDDVRFISNRSSGQMGLALAQAAADAGHDVTLLLGPVMLPAALGDDVQIARFTTTAQLPMTGKAKRGDGLRLELEPTPDLVAQVAKTKRADQQVIAFALEEAAVLEERAAEKMQRKGVDAIVANPLSTMDAQRVAAVLLTADGQRHEPPSTAGSGTDGPGQSKDAFARWLVSWIDRHR